MIKKNINKHLIAVGSKLREKQDLVRNLFCHLKAAKRKAK